MTMEIKACTPEALRFIAENLRDQDEVEVRLLTGKAPHEALVASEASSIITRCIYFDGVPGGVFGISEFTEDVGVPWMVGTDLMVTKSREWLKVAPQMRDIFNARFKALTNVVHEKNTKSIRWLSRLGFSFDKTPIPGLPGFIHFIRTRDV